MTSVLRVLHAHSGNLYGGIERVLVTLQRFQDVSDSRHRFVLSFDGRLRNELGAGVLAVVGAVRGRYPWTVHTARRRLGDLLTSTDADVALVHSGWAQWLFGPVLEEAHLPVARWYHAPAPPDDPWERRAASIEPALVICNSRYTAEGCAGLADGQPVEVIYPPVPVPPEVSPSTRARLRGLAAANPGTVVILHVGRMEAGKGQSALVEALRDLPRSLDWQAWLVGGPQRPSESRYFAQLRAETRRAGLDDRIRFLGERVDTSALYAAADVYCQPNLTPDAFGLTFVEALHAGLPIVTTRLGGAVEIVDATCGVLVPPGDRGALTETLLRLVQDESERGKLGLQGPARATSLCDPARQARQLAAALRAAIEPA